MDSLLTKHHVNESSRSELLPSIQVLVEVEMRGSGQQLLQPSVDPPLPLHLLQRNSHCQREGEERLETV